MPQSSTPPWSLIPLATGAAYLAAAWVSLALTQGIDGIATIWPASGLLLAALLKAPSKMGWRIVVAGGGASIVANLAASNGWALSVGFTVANLIEATTATLLLRRWCDREPSFLKLFDVAKFCAASAIAAAFSATVALIAANGSPAMWSSWFTTDLLGMWIVTPLVLMLVARAGGRDKVGMPASAAETVLLLCVVAAVAGAVFAQQSYPILFLPMVALLATTYRSGPVGAAAGVLIIAALSSALTGAGYGPLILIHDASPTQTALFLQFYVITLFATALPLAALLAARGALMKKCGDSERMYRLLADHSSDMIVRIGMTGVRRYVSPACGEILGHDPAALIGETPASAIHPDDQARVMDTCRSLLDGEHSPICVYRQEHANGTYVWLEAAYRLVRDPDTGSPVEFIATVRDVSRRQEAELALIETTARMQESLRLLSMAEQTAQFGHWRLDVRRNAVLWSDEVFRIHGMDAPNPPLLADAIKAYHPGDRDRVEHEIAHAIASAKGFAFDARIVRPDGRVRHVVSRGQPEQAPDGTVLALFGVIQDVTAQTQAQQSLESARHIAEQATVQAMIMAETDDLTGVANRRRSMSILDKSIAEARARGTALSVAIFDVDHFKRVNDLFGHGIGDETLRLVASTAAASVRPHDLVGRIGGEEFIVVLPDAAAPQGIAIAERVRQSIAAAASADAALPDVTVSVGLASFEDGMTPAMLLQKADAALYEAKGAGRNVLRLAA